MKPKNQKWMIPLLLLLVLVPVFSGLVRERQRSDDSVPADRGVWSICEQQEARSSDFHQCDTTSDRLYVSYSRDSCVDVYDSLGSFLYTLQFPKRQNGGVCVRCEGEQVYILDNDNVLYVFEDRTLIRREISYEEAMKAGYGSDWFREKESNVEVQWDKISWLDEQGAVLKQIDTPAALRQTIPLDEEVVNIVVWVFVGAAVILGAHLIITQIKRREV